MSWRKNVDPLIKDHLELQIKESYREKKAYSKARDKPNAQVWVAVANLSKQVFDLNLKVKFLEKALRDVNIKDRKKIDKDVDKVLKDMEKF
jgi:uncharacterized caspase-like protein